MRALLRIARTEVLEHSRQPWMLVILAVSYLVWLVVFGAVFVVLDQVFARPEALALLQQQSLELGVEFDTSLRLMVSSFGALVFTNLPLFVAIMSGYSVLHDRTCGTMPFLMLAPITRRQVLAGKLLGGMAIPLLLHLLFVGAGTLLLGRLPVLAPYAVMFGSSPAWWLAFLVGAPASAAMVGSLGTVISALSGDVRTSMQYTSFFIGLLSLAIGVVLVDAIAWGPGFQFAFAAGCLVVAALTLVVGAWIISRDVAPS
jgi:ABC-type transport system involved in multi-copper enzyme maturation permease subunit